MPACAAAGDQDAEAHLPVACFNMGIDCLIRFAQKKPVDLLHHPGKTVRAVNMRHRPAVIFG